VNVGQWVDQAREHLGSGVVEQVNRLSAQYNPGDTAITLQYPTDGVAKGVPLCVGLNTMMVWSVTPATGEVEVQSGWAGSSEISAAAGALVRVKPNYYTHRIFDAVNDVLNELSSPLAGIYGVGTIDLTYLQTVDGYSLTAAENLQSVIGVQFGDPLDSTSRWESLSATNDWALENTAPTAQAPSGQWLRIFGPLGTEGTTLRVTYRMTLRAADTLADDVSMTGLPPTAYDLPPLGAAARLAIPGEHRRNLVTGQPDTRRAGEVPPGAVLGGARALQAKYEMRVQQEAARLMAVHPHRMN
jgi:hypothetical protein